LHAFLTVSAILWVVVQIPEIVAVARAAPLAALPIGMVLSALLVALPFTTARRRARAGRRGSHLDPGYRELDLRTGQWGRVSTAARARSAPPNAKRRSDIHWALATLHETQGFLRGGWIQGACSRALAGAALAMLGQWIAGRKLAPEADTLERLSRSLDHSAATMGSHYWLAIGLSIVSERRRR